MANHYDVPSWAGKPPPGLHLDVLKGDKLVQKLIIDEKKSYLFGRNPEINDFCIDHASCSRVHGVLVYHKALDRAFLVDLGSTHGTYIGKTRLEAQKPTFLPIGCNFHFGASTRNYILRERPQKLSRNKSDLDKSDSDGALLGLPETERELDNLTEFNTAHNRRISMLGIPEEEIKPPKRRRQLSVRIKEEEEIINPEDIDPSIGKFRNLVQTAVIPMKRQKLESQNLFGSGLSESSGGSNSNTSSFGQKSSDAPSSLFSPSLSSKLGLHLPNPAPDVDLTPHMEPIATTLTRTQIEATVSNEPHKKKYAKEAWPGKKSAPSFLV